MKYTTINIQGNLLSEEILDQIEQATIEGQSPKDFGLDPNANLRGDMEYAWSRMKLDWKYFWDKTQNLPENGSSTALTKKWMSQFFTTLNFELTAHKSPLMGENGQSYTISHTAHNLDDFPLHIVGFRAPENAQKSSLDIKGANARLSPHANIQEYLNVTEHLYGLIANGFTLRLLRDSGRLVKLAYIEFDLKAMFEEDRYNEFTVIYRLLHSSRFPQKKTETCLLEKYHQDSIESGNRIREKLSAAVKESLLALGKGFLQHENNEDLRQKLKSKQLSHKDLHRQLLRLIYRFLFLMVTEERDLIFAQDEKAESILHKKRLYFQYYSLQRLRKMSQNRSLFQAEFTDLWLGLMQTFQLFEESGYGKPLAIQPLAGDLFHSKAIEDLENCLISNQLLLECISNLNEFIDEKNNRVHINYRSLDVEELGSVYEGLLELHLVIGNLEAENPAHIHFTFHEGTDRKTTGSYYTRPDLVNELIKSALIPVIESRLQLHKGNKNAQAQALLKLKVCDAAAGSGHILLAAARTIAWYLARVQSGEDNPSPTLFRTCLRQVIQHCIYAVDYNPDAVELCKLALWLESHNSGKPISFLDHKIRNGNSLVGVTNLKVLQKGIPDEAFSPVTGDDKEMCKLLKKDNAHFRKTKQITLEFEQNDKAKEGDFSQSYQDFENLAQDDIAAVNQVKYKYQQLRSGAAWMKEWTACNLWTAAFFFPYLPENKQMSPTSERLEKYLQNPAAAYAPMIGKANALAVELKFFHWALEFPDVFAQGGFDVMLGNPPWEMVELNLTEFFIATNPNIANTKNNAIRQKLIAELQIDNLDLYEKYKIAQNYTWSLRRFLQNSARFPLSSNGRIDLYPIFVENTINLVSPTGLISLVIPSDIAFGAYNVELYMELILNQQVKSFFDFVNSKGIFPIHRGKRFCIFTICGKNIKPSNMQVFYFGKDISDLQKKERIITLSIDDLRLFSPNTLSPPIFQNIIDFEISRRIYKRYGVFINKKDNINVWKANIKRMLSLSDKGVEFKKNFEISKEDKSSMMKIYSGKNIYHFNHRFASFDNDDTYDVNIDKLEDSTYSIETENYIKNEDFIKRIPDSYLSNWLIGYRDVTSSMNERTCIAAIIPLNGCDTTCRNIYSDINSTILLLGIVSNLNALCFDFFTKQKIIGSHLNAGTLEQLPVLPPSAYTPKHLAYILPRVLELVYTAYDMQPFAEEIWEESSPALRHLLVKQWEENALSVRTP